MKIKQVHLKQARRYPGDREPISVIRSADGSGKPIYDIDFDAGFYWCRRGDGPTFRVPIHETFCDEPVDPTVAPSGGRSRVSSKAVA